MNASNEYGVTPYLIALDAGDLHGNTVRNIGGRHHCLPPRMGCRQSILPPGAGWSRWCGGTLEQHGLDELDTAHDSLMDVAVKSHQPAIIALLQEYGMEAPPPGEEETRPSPPQPISTIAFFDQLVRRFVRAGKVPVLDSMLDGHGRGTRMADLAPILDPASRSASIAGQGTRDVVFTMFFRHLPTGPPEEIKASYDAIIAMSKRVGDLDMAAECSARPSACNRRRTGLRMTECFRTYQKPPSLITTKDIAMDQFSKVTWRQLSFIPSFTSLRQIRMPISFNMLNLGSFVAVLLLALFCGVCAEAGPASGVFGSAASLVHPKLIRLFSGTMADVGPSAVQTVNVSASAKLGNEYHVADVQRHNSLVYVGRRPIWQGLVWLQVS